MALSLNANVNAFVEQELHRRIRAIESHYKAHVITYIGPIIGGVDDLIRNAIEHRKKMLNPSRKLVFVLTTEGGFIEVVQRIVATMRTHYAVVDFVIPNSAFSAGTVLALSGDAIHMDYYSRLGPIDPQVENDSGRLVPALGYLKKYEALLDKAKHGTITIAEVQILIQCFDQAELDFYEHARQLSITLLEEWLVKYKFKNWKQTQTRKLKVDKPMKKRRAGEIAEILNDTDRWHSHGHGISMEVLTKSLNLIIDDFGAIPALSDCIRSYDDMLTDYMQKVGSRGVVHYTDNYLPF